MGCLGMRLVGQAARALFAKYTESTVVHFSM